MENQTSMKIKTLRFDNAREFVFKKFNDFLCGCEIQQQTSALTHHNKMELQNEPIEPSWNVLET